MQDHLCLAHLGPRRYRVEASSEKRAFDHVEAEVDADVRHFTSLQKLKEAGMLQLTRNVASNVCLGLRSKVSAEALPLPSSHSVRSYEILLELDRTDGLKFSLEDVVTQLVEHFKKGAVE